jgi:hypothetical protein
MKKKLKGMSTTTSLKIKSRSNKTTLVFYNWIITKNLIYPVHKRNTIFLQSTFISLLVYKRQIPGGEIRIMEVLDNIKYNMRI